MDHEHSRMKRYKPSRRTFLKGAAGLSTAVALGGLTGCPAVVASRSCTYAIAGDKGVLTPVAGAGPLAYDLVLNGVSGEVAWAQEAFSGRSGMVSLEIFLGQTWPAVADTLPPHGTVAGSLGDGGAPSGLRIVVESIQADLSAGTLTARVVVFGVLWDALGDIQRGETIALENAVLHMLPTQGGEEDAGNILVHAASSATVDAGQNTLTLEGVPSRMAWMHSGTGRFGGRLPVGNHPLEWESRYGNTKPVAWLWQDGAFQRFELAGAEYAAEEGRLSFAVASAKASQPKAPGGSSVLLVDAGVSDTDSVDFSSMRFTEDDLWVLTTGDNTFRIGLTDYGAENLGDIVYVQIDASFLGFPQHVDEGEPLGNIESVKAATDLYMPLSGTLTASNESIEDHPEYVNNDPYGTGWLCEGTTDDMSQLDSLMTYDQYQAYVAPVA